jgi:tetratricopeptide (TPR) repeat protein
LFARASVLFQAGKFAEAKGLFEAASTGPSREMAHAARQRVRMCEQRIAAGSRPAPATAEEHYNYAVALMNRADFQAAREHLEQALETAGDPDHIHYSLALCLGSLGDLEGACRHLKRAIEIHPRNRAMARNDPDFAELAHRPPISELLAGEPGRI